MKIESVSCNTETFGADKSFDRPILFISWGCGLFALVAFVSCLFLASNPKESAGEVLASGVCVVLFGGLAVLVKRQGGILKKISVSLDEEGIWQTETGKEMGIVRWPSIRMIRERPILQRLDLMNESGVVLFKVEYQTSSFARLCGILLQKLASNLPKDSAASEFKLPVWHQVANLTLIGAQASGSVALLSGKSVWLGIVMIATTAMITAHYVSHIRSVKVENDVLEIRRLFHRGRFPLDAVEDLALRPVSYQGSFAITASVGIRGRGKPFTLGGLLPGAIQLLAVINANRRSVPPPRSSI